MDGCCTLTLLTRLSLGFRSASYVHALHPTIDISALQVEARGGKLKRRMRK
jgi:hypothetical protein